MAGKGKREPKRRAGPGAFVDLNVWDVLLGLMEPAEEPEHDPKPSEAGPAAAGEIERDEPARSVGAARQETSQKPRRETKRKGEGEAASKA